MRRPLKAWYRRYQYNGQMLTIPELSELTGIRAQTLRKRLEVLGWPVVKAVTTPVRPHTKGGT